MKTILSVLQVQFKAGVVAVLLIIGVLIQLQFSKPVLQDSAANAFVKEFVTSELAVVSNEIAELAIIAAQYAQGDKVTVAALQEQLTRTRLAYKRIESVTTYYLPEHEKYYINGAPLLHVDPYPIGESYKDKSYYALSAVNYKDALPLDKMEAGHYLDGTTRVIEPVGLQRLDELIFTDEVLTEKETIVRLTKDLQVKFRILKNDLNNRQYFYDFEVLEFTRLALIRIMTKGITGFDTPGSLHGIAEAAATLSGIEDILNPYLAKITDTRKQELQKLFEQNIKYVQKHNNFEKFDRLVFIKEYLNPLYQNLGELRKNLAVPSVAERYQQTASWNANSSNFFDSDFLNPYYYSMLKERDDSQELRTIGKKLFYDANLSNTGTLSCASCHMPELGYADGYAKSPSGIPGKTLDRNAPTLINAVFADRYFYDLRAFDLEDQAEHVIESHIEFNTSFEAIVAKLNTDLDYKTGFKEVFGTEEVTKYKFAAALASYVISLRSFDSEFDKYMRGEIGHLDRKVKKGFNLFMGKANCATCHYPPTFSGLVPPLFHENESEILGVLESPGVLKSDGDKGRYSGGVANENVGIYKGSFKTVTVRNVALTAPYFHNGAYNTLDEVLDFYNTGGAQGVGLSYEVPNQTLSADHLNLSKGEIAALKAFMESLTAIPTK